ncbi:MAG: response regulator transcription factor [Deltaproteobacteria bacterium]|nr:response regulator transcription factor [Deltaproteobacteria bacterium]
MSTKEVTRILFIDDDETSFQFRKCMVQVLQQIPPVELFHAQDATEGLSLLEKIKPNVVVLDENLCEECDLFLDSLSKNHPPIVMQTENRKNKSKHSFRQYHDISYIKKNESLAGIHETLMVVTDIAHRRIQTSEKLN